MTPSLPKSHRFPFNSRVYLALLGRLTRVFRSSLNPHVILKLALKDVVRLLRGTGGSVALINPKTGFLMIEASVGLSSKDGSFVLKPNEGIMEWVALHGRAARVGNIRKDPRYSPKRTRIRSELAVPLEGRLHKGADLQNGGGVVMGVLNVTSIRPDAFSATDEELLLTLADQVSDLIRSAWLYEQARQRGDRLDDLLALSRHIMEADTLTQVLNRVVVGTCRLMGASYGELLLLDETATHLKWAAASEKPRTGHTRFALPVDDSLMGMAVRRKKPVTTQNIKRFGSSPFIKPASYRRLISFLGVPLLTGGRVLGTLGLYTDRAHLFSKDEIQILEALSNQAALAIQRGHLAERLVSAEEQLRQNERLSAIGLLAAEVAHEIRNPLTVVKMLTHSLEKEIQGDNPRRRDFEILSRKMDQMNQIVERILGLARSSDPVFEEVSFDVILDELQLLVRHKLAQQQIRLKMMLHKNLPRVRMDRAQMEQALLNIVLNALHSMPEGGVLQLRTGKVLDKVWIEVSDSGVGMSERQKESLFQPFLTSRVKGTGLGMAIVNKIVQAHHGTLGVKSYPGRGTIVRITLPLATKESIL